MTICAVVTMIVVSGTASAGIVVNSGSIYTVDPTATSYGAVRFKDFTNSRDGYRSAGNLYLQNSSGSLGSPTGSDGRARVQTDADNGPVWAGGNSYNFTFEYRPVAGATDLILAKAGIMSSGLAMTTPISRDINDPVASVNFISFFIHNTPLSDVVTPDTIGLTLTDLDGNLLTPSLLSVGAPGGDYNWYLTDPALLANGFILTGFVNLTTGVDGGESDKIDIAFGNVPEPATMSLLGLGALTLLRRKRKA